MTASTTQSIREQILELVTEINAYDEVERTHIATTISWITSGAPLFRIAKPAVPPMHLVSYFVILDSDSDAILLGAHRKAGRWLPTGGHLEPGELPWDAVRRECAEELQLSAQPDSIHGTRPFFLTVNKTLGAGVHDDVSLWHVLRARKADIAYYDQEEYTSLAWLSPQEILDEPREIFDAHMRRFVRKFLASSEIP